MQDTQAPRIRMQDEHQVPIVWHSLAPSFIASFPSSSLQDIIDRMM